jgi:hypothetical protein
MVSLEPWSKKRYTFHSERDKKSPSQFERLVQANPTEENPFQRLIFQWAKNALIYGMQFAL